MSIEVLNESGSRPRRARAGAAGRFVMDRMRVHPLAELCIKAVDEATIAELNQQWMEKEGPTDVLAFPMDELRPGLVNEEPEEGVLGDLVLCPEVAERQARPPATARDGELDLLTVHGILHLLGYDHAEPDEHRRCSGSRTSCWPSGAPGDPTDASADEQRRRLAAGHGGRLRPPRRRLLGRRRRPASFSRARAQELAGEGRAGARRLVTLLDDAAALPQHRAAAAAALRDRRDRARHPAGQRRLRRRVLAGAGDLDRLMMALVVLRGHRRRPAHPRAASTPQRIALAAAGPISLVDHDPRPDPAAADPARQRDHPRAGLPRGTVLHRDRAARAGRPRRGVRA